ncbi:hypothetical protein [Bremerella alba]|nr:hypothetical protein [Bremerella alba]
MIASESHLPQSSDADLVVLALKLGTAPLGIEKFTGGRFPSPRRD